MPRVTQQTSRSTAVAPTNNGKLLSHGIPVEELAVVTRASVLIYGGNRVGKTTLACQFDKPLALISFEPSPFTGGASSVTRIPGVTYFQVAPFTAQASWPKTKAKPIFGSENAVALSQELSQSNFKTVVLDGATSLEDVCLTELMNLPELPQQLKVAQEKGDTSWGVVPDGAYQDRSAKAKEILRKFLNLPQNVIILGKEKDHNPPKDDRGKVRRDKMTRGLQIESFVGVGMGQASALWLHDACDWLTRLYLARETEIVKVPVAGVTQEEEHETGRTVRRLLLHLQTNFAAGGRASNYKNVPEYIEDTTPEGMYQKFAKIIRGEKLS